MTADAAWYTDFRSKLVNLVTSSEFFTGWSRKKSDTVIRPSRQELNSIFPEGARWPMDREGNAEYECEVSSEAESYHDVGTSMEDSLISAPPMWLDVARSHNDTLEMQHFGSIEGLLTLGKHDLGVGHRFHVTQLLNATWCDKCGEFIWGIFKQALRCELCNYTCHYKCRMLVTLDCRSVTDSLKSDKTQLTFVNNNNFSSPIPDFDFDLGSETSDVDTSSSATEGADNDFNDDESVTIFNSFRSTDIVDALGYPPSHKPLLSSSSFSSDYYTEDDGPRTPCGDQPPTFVTSSTENTPTADATEPCFLPPQMPSGAELQSVIDKYNESMNDGLKMTIEENGVSFNGFIRIHMNFNRPINVVAGQRPPTIYDVVSGEETAKTTNGRKTLVSFYLPRNTVKILHITSETTTQEMVVALLKKFKVADNPSKFALYERDLGPGKTLQARLRRIQDNNCPLRLALLSPRRFVLQENETGDINWDAFEIPELNNFLRILDREEQQYLAEIRFSYFQFRQHLNLELKERQRSLNAKKSTASMAASADSANSSGYGSDSLANSAVADSVDSLTTNTTSQGQLLSDQNVDDYTEDASDDFSYDSGTMIVNKDTL